jgi:hypothetical protein
VEDRAPAQQSPTLAQDRAPAQQSPLLEQDNLGDRAPPLPPRGNSCYDNDGMGLVDCNQLLIPGFVQNPVLTKMILKDYPEFVSDEFNWQQHVDWVMKKVEWEKARGTDLAKLFPLVEEEVSFMHTYLTIATAERDRLANRVNEFENMQHIWVEQEEEYEEMIKELRAQLAEAEKESERLRNELQEAQRVWDHCRGTSSQLLSEVVNEFLEPINQNVQPGIEGRASSSGTSFNIPEYERTREDPIQLDLTVGDVNPIAYIENDEKRRRRFNTDSTRLTNNFIKLGVRAECFGILYLSRLEPQQRIIIG